MTETVLETLEKVLEERKFSNPELSYVASLYDKGLDAILDKINEEANETIEAGKSDDNDHLIHETADLWFHTLVLLAHKGLSYKDVIKELESRFGVSGHDEKSSRES